MSFNFSKYPVADEEEEQQVSEPSSPFNFSKYPEDASQKSSIDPYALTDIEKELVDLSPSKIWGSFGSGVASGASASASEYIPGLETGEGGTVTSAAENAGKFIGMALPIGLGAKALSYPISWIPKAYKWGTRLAETAAAGTAFGGYEAAREVISNEGLDPGKIATDFAIGAGGHALISSIIGGIKGGKAWLEKLNPKAQSELLEKGILPPNMSASDIKLYDQKIVPKIMEEAEKDYATALNKAQQKVEETYQQELQQFKGDQAKVAEAKANYEAKVAEIEEINKQAVQEFTEQSEAYEASLQRQEAVSKALGERYENPKPLKGRVTQSDEDLGILPSGKAQPKVEEQVGNLISQRKFSNKTQGGEDVIKAVRASSDADYAVARELYSESDAFAKDISGEHPELLKKMQQVSEELKDRANLSPLEQQQLGIARKLIRKLAKFTEEGEIDGFNKLTNEFLLDEGKAIRKLIDFEYKQGSPSGILKPMLSAVEDAALDSAMKSGNTEAVEALGKARKAYSEWASLYDNAYMRKFRSNKNLKPVASLDSALNIDNFSNLNRVLSRSPSGAQVSDQVRRELIDKYLEKFYKNPSKAPQEGLLDVLEELSPILKEGEASQIRDMFSIPKIDVSAKQLPKVSKPKQPKLEKSPKPPTQKEPKLPEKLNPEKDADVKKAANNLNITPEKAMSMADSVSGLRQLKIRLGDSNQGKELYQEAVNHKLRSIFRGGKVKGDYTGEELYKAINNSKNFDIITEILGEDEALNLLERAEEIGKNKITTDRLKKIGSQVTTLKILSLAGIL